MSDEPLLPPIQVPADAIVVPFSTEQGLFDGDGRRLYETAFARFAHNLARNLLPEHHLISERLTGIDRYGSSCTWCELVRSIVAWDLDVNLAALCKIIILIEPLHRVGSMGEVIDAYTSDSVPTAQRLWRSMCR